MPDTKPYDPNDPSTWGAVIGKDAKGNPIYANQPPPAGAPPAVPPAAPTGPTTTAGKSGPTPVGSNTGPVSGTDGTTPATTPTYSDPPSDNAVWDGAKWVYNNAPLAKSAVKSFTDPKGFVSDLLGMGGDNGAATQTQLAKDVTAQSTGNAQTLYQQALDQVASANAINAPAAIQSGAIVAQQLNAGNYNVNTDTTADSEDATLKMKAYQAALAQASDAAVQNVRQANVENVAAVDGADVARVNTNITAPTIGAAAQTGLVTVGGTKIDPLATQLRGQQVAAAERIANGPSAAMAQFQAGQSQVVKDQLAIAAASRGAERAGARREAMINVGASGAQNNLAAASLAAQETQAKNVAASAALTGVRAADVTTAQTQAQITSQQQQLQAQLDSAIAQGNTSAVNAIKSQQAQLSLTARTAEVGAGINQQSTLANVAQSNTALQQQTAMANAANANKSAADYAAAVNASYGQLAQNQTSVSVGNAGSTTAASKDFANAYNSAADAAAARATNTNVANAALTQQQAQTNANRAAAVDTTNVTGTNTANTANVANSLAAQTATAGNTLATNQLKQQGATAAINAGTSAVGVQSKDAQTIVDANKSGAEAAAKEKGALIGAGGAIIGAVASDRRIKEDIKKIPDSQLADLAAHMGAYTFRYKKGFEDEGASEHGSQMAQELEKSALGKKFVHKRSDGVKTIDTLALASMMAAAAASSLRKGRANA